MPDFLPIINVPYSNASAWSVSELESGASARTTLDAVTPADAQKVTATRYRDLAQTDCYAMQRPRHYTPAARAELPPVGQTQRVDKADRPEHRLTLITGAGGHQFTLINGKQLTSGQYGPGKKILGYGGSCKVRDALWMTGPTACQPVAVKKVSTGYGRFDGSDPKHPRWTRITDVAVEHTARSLSLTPEDEHFLKPIDYAIFEQTDGTQNRDHPLLKLYAFFPKCPQDLTHKIEHGNVTPGEAQAFAKQCIETLQALRKHNLVHLDIKPDNYLITEEGKLRLTDFVFAQKIGSVADNRTRYRARLGTQHYVPQRLNDGEWLRPLTAKQLQQRDLIATAQLLYKLDNKQSCLALYTSETPDILDSRLFAFPNRRSTIQFTLSEVAKEIMARILIDGKDITPEEILQMEYFKWAPHEAPRGMEYIPPPPPPQNDESPLPLAW